MFTTTEVSALQDRPTEQTKFEAMPELPKDWYRLACISTMAEISPHSGSAKDYLKGEVVEIGTPAELSRFLLGDDYSSVHGTDPLGRFLDILDVENAIWSLSGDPIYLQDMQWPLYNVRLKRGGAAHYDDCLALRDDESVETILIDRRSYPHALVRTPRF
jgi:hypothetical protein